MCRQRKLKVSRVKTELIQRLKQHEISSINQPQLTINENSVIILKQPAQLIPVIFEEFAKCAQTKTINYEILHQLDNSLKQYSLEQDDQDKSILEILKRVKTSDQSFENY